MQHVMCSRPIYKLLLNHNDTLKTTLNMYLTLMINLQNGDCCQLSLNDFKVFSLIPNKMTTLCIYNRLTETKTGLSVYAYNNENKHTFNKHKFLS